jgi:hypothetical protein
MVDSVDEVILERDPDQLPKTKFRPFGVSDHALGLEDVSPEYRENFPMIELKDEREEYIVTANLVPELFGEFITKTLFTAINRQGTVFFWPIRLPSPDGKDLDWWRSGGEAAELATKCWIRARANMNLRKHDGKFD